jgi:type I restriction-modification system DNA methylase subunit
MEIIDFDFKEKAHELANEIKKAAQLSHNEPELRTKISSLLNICAKDAGLNLHPREEYTLINGRADAVYNRLIIEYEPPFSLRERNSYRTNQHAISQIKRYIEGLVRRERHRPERVVGVVLDGNYFIFVRKKENSWQIEAPLKVDEFSTEYFLKLLFSLSKELALIPENLVRDFGENTVVSRKMVSSLFSSLNSTDNPKIKAFFHQWSLQFSEVCDYEEASKLKIENFARNFGIIHQKTTPFPFFFCLHTYYATFIKLLAFQIAQYYTIPKLGISLKQVATFKSEELKDFFKKLEDGLIFKELGINNFIEGDFFSWYLEAWNDKIYDSFKALVSALANYSLLTLDVDPDTTRDLLKKLYQELMPKDLRHNLGEYYTPDWLAERLLNMLGYDGNPDKRILDPSCGSGTFLVLAIKRAREYIKNHHISEDIALDKILSNIVGFDLNPLAVISARTNYLLALGNLLQYRKGEINIPVYFCDSIMTPQEGKDIFTKDVVKFNTAVGHFVIPKSLIQAQYIDILSNFLEEAVKLNFSKDQFIDRLCEKLPLIKGKDDRDINILYELYEKLLNLERQGINGIWARIIKNAFAPLFVAQFDYIAGNPPWINWEHLPEGYRLESKPLWEHYGLFPHGGMDTILGKGKKDISMILTYVSIDKYLKKNGKLGFVITQSVFKTAGAGQGFRRFILPDSTPLGVLYVDDMVKLKPFEGVGNRTSIVILQKGKQTKYPIPYNYWVKKVKRKGIKDSMSLDEVMEIATYKQFYAEPVNQDDPTSPWITGKPKAIKAVRKVLGKSEYIAHAGVCSGGANAVYWVNIVGRRPDGLVIISNITAGQKKEVESLQVAIEPDLLYPLLRGRDVKRWKAEPSAYILMVQDPVKRRGIDENELKTKYPKTYLYLKRFEKILRERSAFKRYFTRKSINGRIVETGPFYSMFDVGDYTFAPYKVVWRYIAADFICAVTLPFNEKPIIPNEKLILIACNNENEAYYICGLCNCSPTRFAVISYGVETQLAPHLIQNIHIPKFDPKNELHIYLAKLSLKAHEAAKKNEQEILKNIEEEIDKISAQIWGLTEEELNQIKISLKELTE